MNKKQRCKKCNKVKSIIRFRKYRHTCKLCEKAYSKNWDNKNKNRQHLWYLKNKIRLLKRRKEYYLETREQTLATNKKWNDTHKKERAIYLKQWKKEYLKIPENRIVDRLRNRIYQALKGKNKSAHTMELIGCSIEFLKTHLESQFTVGMSWSNYGFYGWHIDHIIPCNHFNLLEPKQQKICFSYKNLQPLWMEENISKGNKERILSHVQ